MLCFGYVVSGTWKWNALWRVFAYRILFTQPQSEKCCFKEILSHENRKHDTVMVENREATSLQNCNSSVTSVWITIWPFLSKIKLTAAHKRKSRKDETKRFRSAEVEDETDLYDNKLCFVQWYEIPDRQMLVDDRIDKALGSARLRWQRKPEKSNVLPSGCEFGFVAISSVKGLVHIVLKSPFTSTVNDNARGRKACLNLAKDSCRREADRLYVNRFYELRIVEINENEAFTSVDETVLWICQKCQKIYCAMSFNRFLALHFHIFAFRDFNWWGWRECIHRCYLPRFFDPFDWCNGSDYLADTWLCWTFP